MPGTETSPVYGLSIWAGPQATPWEVENTVQRAFEALIRASVSDRDLAAAPGSCADGEAFLVAGTPAGGDPWEGKGGQMAVAVGVDASNGWIFLPVETEGFSVWIDDEDKRIYWDGAAWVDVATGGGSGGAPEPASTETIAGTAYTLVLADGENKYLRATDAGGCAITVPPNSDVAFASDTVITIRAATAGIVSLVAGSGVTLNPPGGAGASLEFAEEGAVVQIKQIAADEWDVIGGTASA